MKNFKKLAHSTGLYVVATLVFLFGLMTVVNVSAYNVPGQTSYLSGTLLTLDRINEGFIFDVEAQGGGFSERKVNWGINYDFGVAAPNTFDIEVFRDSNGNGTQENWEEQGSTNDVFLAVSTSSTVDISMSGTDVDSDGMPDWWEYEGFGNITNTVAGADYDGDGVFNGDEYARGTDPTDPDDCNITLYAKSDLGDDTYDGFYPTHSFDDHGPKLTITASLLAADDGDAIEISGANAFDETTLSGNGKNITLKPIGNITIN